MSQTPETQTASAHEVLAFAKTLEAKAKAEMIRLRSKSETIVKNSNAALAITMQYDFAEQTYQAAGYLISVTTYALELEQACNNLNIANLTPAEQGLKDTIRRQRDKIKSLEAALYQQREHFNERLDEYNITR